MAPDTSESAGGLEEGAGACTQPARILSDREISRMSKDKDLISTSLLIQDIASINVMGNCLARSQFDEAMIGDI